MTTRQNQHWANQRERGNVWLLCLTAWAARRLGRRAIAPIVWSVVLYFYLTGSTARREIAGYQQRLSNWSERPDLFPARAPVYRQYLAFADAMLDTLDVWQGKLTSDDVEIDDPDDLHRQMQESRGQIFVGAHLGNLEICRALATQKGAVRLNVLVHSKNAVQFNQMLTAHGAGNLNLIQVSELDAPAMMRLDACIARGEWLAIAGDRVPLHGARTVEVNFLGQSALLPQGPWLLAGMLKCPINLLLCTKAEGTYRVKMMRLSDAVTWTRTHRTSEIQRHAQHFADCLASQCQDTPLQWFNFYRFWRSHPDTPAA